MSHDALDFSLLFLIHIYADYFRGSRKINGTGSFIATGAFFLRSAIAESASVILSKEDATT